MPRPFAGVLALLVTVVVLLLAAPAGAHAVLLTMSPEPDAVLDTPPTEVVLTFSEPISIPPDAIRVFDPSGRQLRGVEATAHDATMRAELPDLTVDGSYTVAWKMVSADGHALSGAYLFHLRTATLTEPIDAASVGVATWPSALRALGSALALGALTYLLARSFAGGSATTRRGWVVWSLALFGTLLSLFGSAMAVGASFADGLDVSLSTSTGRIGAAACGVVALGLLLSAVRTPVRILRVVAVAAVVTLALEGHAVALDPVALSATLTVLHVLAALVWAAGLLWLERRTRLATPAELRTDVLRRSPWAMAAVLVLAATGVTLVLQRVPVDELLTSWYGRLAIAKVALLGVAVILAIRNRSVASSGLPESESEADASEPETAEAESGGSEAEPEGEGAEPEDGTRVVEDTDGSPMVRLLRSSVRVEIVVLALALLVGASLAQIAPPEAGGGSGGGPFDQQAPFGDGQVTLTVDPGARGTNEVHVTALGEDGRLMAGVEELAVQLSLPSDNIGPLTPEMQPIVPGHSVSYARFPFAGEWTVLVTAKIGKFEALSAVFTVPISD